MIFTFHLVPTLDNIQNLNLLLGCGISITMVMFFMWSFWRDIAKNKAIIETKLKELGSIEKIELGKPLIGLKNIAVSDRLAYCVVNDHDFIFLRRNGFEFGRIKRSSVNKIIISDRFRIAENVTAGSLLLLGSLAFAFPQTYQQRSSCLVIDWDTDDGTKENTIFEFMGADCNLKADTAALSLKKYIQKLPLRNSAAYTG